MPSKEVARSIHEIIPFLHLAVDSKEIPKGIDRIPPDETTIYFDDTLHAYRSIVQFRGIASHQDGRWRKVSEPAENGGVMRQVVKCAEVDAAKHQSNIQFKRAPILRYLTVIIVLILGEGKNPRAQKLETEGETIV